MEEIQHKLGKKAVRTYLPTQKSGVPVTFADCHLLERLTGYRAATGVREGCRRARRLV
jgi:UDP-glucuronate 4-epimerase